MDSMTLQQQQNASELSKRFVALIQSIWILTSEFPVSDEDLERRAEAWCSLLGPDFFEKYDRFIPYLIKQCCRVREWRGVIHADEFYRMFYRVCVEKQVWSIGVMEWISEHQAIELILLARSDWSEEFWKADEAGNTIGKEEILYRCRAIIYGWEE